MKFLKVDVEVCPEVALKANVSTLPAFLIIQNGQIVETLVGDNEHDLLGLIFKYKVSL
jgi:hypothetical protein